MVCPYCHHPESHVMDTRSCDEGLGIRRRRRCAACDARYTTYERVQLEPLSVIKSNQSKEVFDPTKLLRGLQLAAHKRPIDHQVLIDFAYNFEASVKEPTITSKAIGTRVLSFLHTIDLVAYIRFASVYREFDSLERFMEEVGLQIKVGTQMQAESNAAKAESNAAKAESNATEVGLQIKVGTQMQAESNAAKAESNATEVGLQSQAESNVKVGLQSQAESNVKVGLQSQAESNVKELGQNH